MPSSVADPPDAGITVTEGEGTEPKLPWISIAAGVLVAFLAWPITSLLPRVGLDASWNAGLHMATHSGMQFGKDIVFTYGPYGFLSVPGFFFGLTGYTSLFYSGLVIIAFSVTVIHLGRRSFTLLGAVVLAYAALLLTYFDPAEIAVVVFAIWCLSWLRGLPDRGVPRSFPFWGGAFAALQLLVKFDAGIASIAIVGLTVWGARGKRIRNELIATGCFLGSFVILWVIAGQHLGGIPRYLHRSFQVASGYSAAMGSKGGPELIAYMAVGVVLFIVFPLILVRGHLPVGSRWVTFLLLAVITYTQFLHGFIRHDWYHVAPFLIFAAVLPVALPWKGILRGVALGCCVFPLVVAGTLPIHGRSLKHEATVRPAAVLRQLQLVFDPSYRRSQLRADRLAMRAVLSVDPAALALLANHRVAIDPWEISTAWAYGLDWQPVPVFQDYSAYTSALDDLNAATLASPSGPDRILRRGTIPAIDTRYALFDSPAYQLAMICNFADLHDTHRWEVLGRIPDRCSTASLIETVSATAGQLVAVPRPGRNELVYASFDVTRSLSDRLLAAIFKPPGWPQILLNGRPYRLIVATAAEPHVLCIPSIVSSLEYGGGRCPTTVGVNGTGAVTIRFYTIRLAT